MRLMHLIFFWSSPTFNSIHQSFTSQLLTLWDTMCQVHWVRLTCDPVVSSSWGQGLGEGHLNWKMCSLARCWEEGRQSHWPCVTSLQDIKGHNSALVIGLQRGVHWIMESSEAFCARCCATCTHIWSLP